MNKEEEAKLADALDKVYHLLKIHQDIFGALGDSQRVLNDRLTIIENALALREEESSDGS